jgi:hypothetical protein
MNIMEYTLTTNYLTNNIEAKSYERIRERLNMSSCPKKIPYRLKPYAILQSIHEEEY